MATGSALNLSLLSRGVGEVTRNGSEKVDVIFEPQDYFNFVEESHDRPFFLPPLQPRYGFTQEPSQLSSRYSQSKDAVHLPKTFTTRKGALLLFSEDMAHKTKANEAKKHKHHHGYHSDRDMTLSTLEETNSDRDLKTVDDLAKSILAYGSIDESGNMNLKVMAQRTKKRRYDFERQIRPGFSAKRYLSTWTKTWDDTTLEKVISKGYLTEKSLFYYNPLLPHLSRRLNDDLSHYPTPYKLMRSMLMSPGSLSGYTFYRVRPESQETDYLDISEDEEMRSLVKSRQAGSVKVASVTADGQLKEAIYGQLDRQAQAEVLTDLLVKGAVHYAMKTQQEYAERIVEEAEVGSDTKVVPKFDMRDAVESMLIANDQRGVPQQTLDADLPERDDRSQHSGSFKGSKLGSHRLHSRDRGQGDGQWRDDASSGSSTGAPGPLPTSQAPLPPIGQTYTQLTPIGEASREHTQAFSLPVNEKDDDDGDDWAGRRMVEKHIEQKVPSVDVSEDKRKAELLEKRKARVSAQSLDLDGAPVGAGFSSSDSVGPGSTHSSGWLPPVHKQQWKGSQQSLRSHGSRRASGSQVDADAGSTKGSIIYGPDGSVIKVGETVKLSARASQQSYHDSHEHLQPGLIDASDDSDAEGPDAWKLQGRKTDMRKQPKRESPRSKVTEQEIIDKLTSHATHIAESVLSHSESGQLLEEDIRTVIQEVMKVQKRNSAGPTVAEYRDQIRGNLMTALAKATGLPQSDIPQDAEIDPELLEQLANNSLAPDDIEIVRDDETGRSFIRSRNRKISEAMGGVEKGHIYQPGGKNSDAGKRVSIPSERKPAEIGELDIINYQGQESEKDSSKGSEVGSKKLSSGKPKSVSQDGDAKSSRTGQDSQGQDELQKALADLEQGGSPAVSLKSGKSGKTQKSDDKKSKVSEKKAPSPEKKEEFVVGKVQNKKELEELYSQPVHAPEPKESVLASGVDHTKENTKIYGMSPNIPVSPRKPKEKKPAKAPVGKKKPEKGGKKGKGKAKKKEEPAPEPETAVEADEPPPVKEKTPEPVKEKTPKTQTPVSERTESAKQESDDDEEYIIVRDETMSPEVEQPDIHLNMTTSAEEEEPDEEQITAEDLEDMSEADKLRMISNREARAAKRAAAAEKRRQEVERKRREREEQIKREKEEHERQEVLRQEQEELRKRKEEERRLKKQKEEEENEELMKEELEKQRREKAEADKERRRKEEYAKKLEMMKAKQAEEEKRRQEEAERKRLEEEERRKEEEELMAKMAEEERLEYERKKKLEEEERLRKEEEEKKRREEEAQRALEEARRLAEEMARKQAELEARLRFNRSLQMEANGLEHTQDITKAFVFSYFELLQWLGLDIPEFELLKLNQY